MVEKPFKIICYNKKTIKLAEKFGWLPGARYTNLRDVRGAEVVGLIDIDWKNYSFNKHLLAVKLIKPLMTVARDILNIKELDSTIGEAYELNQYCTYVIIVPKDNRMHGKLNELIPKEFLIGYSVPTGYGGTSLPTENFTRPVHLLGGRPDFQRRLGNCLKVFSIDCNRITLDAKFGDYFDGETFRPHPGGGYYNCVIDSIRNINKLWKDYSLNK